MKARHPQEMLSKPWAGNDPGKAPRREGRGWYIDLEARKQMGLKGRKEVCAGGSRGRRRLHREPVCPKDLKNQQVGGSGCGGLRLDRICLWSEA